VIKVPAQRPTTSAFLSTLPCSSSPIVSVTSPMASVSQTFADFPPWLAYRPVPLQSYLPFQPNFLTSKFVQGNDLKNSM